MNVERCDDRGGIWDLNLYVEAITDVHRLLLLPRGECEWALSMGLWSPA